MLELTELRDDQCRTGDHGFYRHEGTGPTHDELVEAAKQEIREALARDLVGIWSHRRTPEAAGDMLYSVHSAEAAKLFFAACSAAPNGSTYGEIGEKWWRWQREAIAAEAKSIANLRQQGHTLTWEPRETKR